MYLNRQNILKFRTEEIQVKNSHKFPSFHKHLCVILFYSQYIPCHLGSNQMKQVNRLTSST
jgi:hypothetical protein